jgi:hypothetical protein
VLNSLHGKATSTPGALYHVTSRGDRREDIYIDDNGRIAWLEGLGNICARFNWVVHAYCLMVKEVGDKCASFASTFNPADSAAAYHTLLVQFADPTPLRLAR